MVEKFSDLLDKDLGFVIDEYCLLYNPECDYYYGVTTWDNANQLYEELVAQKNDEDVISEFFVAEELIPMDSRYELEYDAPI